MNNFKRSQKIRLRTSLLRILSAAAKRSDSVDPWESGYEDIIGSQGTLSLFLTADFPQLIGTETNGKKLLLFGDIGRNFPRLKRLRYLNMCRRLLQNRKNLKVGLDCIPSCGIAYGKVKLTQ